MSSVKGRFQVGNEYGFYEAYSTKKESFEVAQNLANKDNVNSCVYDLMGKPGKKYLGIIKPERKN